MQTKVPHIASPQVSKLVCRVEWRGEVLQGIHVVRSLHLVHEKPHLDLHKKHKFKFYLLSTMKGP